MNKEYKGNLVKHYMVFLFDNFFCYFIEQVRSYTLLGLNKFDFSLGLQKTFNFQMKVLQNNANLKCIPSRQELVRHRLQIRSFDDEVKIFKYTCCTKKGQY